MTTPDMTPGTPALDPQQLVIDFAKHIAENPPEWFQKVQEKPGVRTTEFGIATLLTVAGGAMHFWPGHEVHGTIIAVVAFVAYTFSRTMVKIKQA